MSEGQTSLGLRSAGLDSLSRGTSSRESRHVRLQDTPEYIPMLNKGMLYQMGCNTPPIGQTRKPKNDTGTLEDEDKVELMDIEAETTSSANGLFGGISLQSAAKLIVASKRAVKRAKSRCGQRAAKKLLKQASSNGELFRYYNLTDMHNKIKRQRQMRLAFLQKQFLDELPVLAERSVKEHLAKRIEVLEKLKKNSFMTESKQLLVENLEHYERPNSRVLTRRQSQLRKSIDLSNVTLETIMRDIKPPELTPTKEDLEKLLAVAKSREKIEVDLDLPSDRLKRLSELKQNVNKINDKFKSLRNKKGNGNQKLDDEEAKEKEFYAPSRFIKNGMALTFFRRYVRIVVIVQQWIKMIMTKQFDFEKELKSFVDIASDIEHQTISSSMMEFGLSFDRKYYKANTEISLSSEHRKILTTRSNWRTKSMIKQVMNGLQSLRSLSEYPSHTQQKLCQVAWYQTIGPKKLIIRQGHHAEAFYFILSGTAFVKKMTQDPVTGESKATVAARLTRGHSFGEIGLLFNTLRTATVESATPMELLVIGKEDFIRIFMKADNPDDEPDHIKFLRQIPFIKNWPLELLREEPGACLVHYFKRGALITENDKHSEWIYVIMSGSCEVLKKLRGVKGRTPTELRPKSHPYTDIMLPQLGMPNNHPKIDTGRKKNDKVLINPELYRSMTDYYDGLRRKLIYEKKKDEEVVLNESINNSLPRLPEQKDKQMPKLFLRSASACKVRFDDNPIDEYQRTKGKTDGDIRRHEPPEYKMKPFEHENKRRPSSRSKFDENAPKIATDHFRVPSRTDLRATYRPGSLDIAREESKWSHEDVFIKVELLYAKNTFGLNTLRYCMDAEDEVFDLNNDMDPPILSLVSCGAEVIMLSKKVFLKYADQKCRTDVREQIKVYPTEDILQENMQNEADWSLFKSTLLETQLKDRKLRERLHTQSMSGLV